MNKLIYLLAILFLRCAVPQTPQTVPLKTVAPNNANIRVTGRIKNEGDSVTIYWSGTSVLMRFTGDELKAVLKDERGDNYFNIVIDNDSLRYIKLDSVKKSYTLASGLGEGEHTIELVKRTEWDKGKTWFYGLELNGASLAPLPAKNKRVIEFFGNSITAGYAIEDNTGGDSPDSIFTNHYYTYGRSLHGILKLIIMPL